MPLTLLDILLPAMSSRLPLFTHALLAALLASPLLGAEPPSGEQGQAQREACARSGFGDMPTLARLLPQMGEAERQSLLKDVSFWQRLSRPFAPHPDGRCSPEWEAACIACAEELLSRELDVPEGVQAALEHLAHRLAYKPESAWENHEGGMVSMLTRFVQDTEEASSASQQFSQEAAADFIALLLRQGADAYTPVGCYERACAADVLAAFPVLSARLRAQKLLPEPPGHGLAGEGLEEMLHDIPCAAIRDAEAEPCFGRIAELITGPLPATGHPAIIENHLHGQAAVHALRLLLRVDAPRLQQRLMAQPAWSDPSAWQGEAARETLHFFDSLNRYEGAALPPAFLRERAEAMDAAAQPALAYAFARLLEKDRTPLPAGWQQGSSPALRAAALTAELHRRGLPAYGDLRQKLCYKELPTEPALRLVLAAESCGLCPYPGRPQVLVYRSKAHDTATQGQRDTIGAALRALGAPLAAAWYEGAEADPAAARFELEIAVAQHILRHETAFRACQTAPYSANSLLEALESAFSEKESL